MTGVSFLRVSSTQAGQMGGTSPLGIVGRHGDDARCTSSRCKCRVGISVGRISSIIDLLSRLHSARSVCGPRGHPSVWGRVQDRH